jgi:hypothetical protein
LTGKGENSAQNEPFSLDPRGAGQKNKQSHNNFEIPGPARCAVPE